MDLCCYHQSLQKEASVPSACLKPPLSKRAFCEVSTLPQKSGFFRWVCCPSCLRYLHFFSVFAVLWSNLWPKLVWMNKYIPVCWTFLAKGACLLQSSHTWHLTTPPLSPKTFHRGLGRWDGSVGKGVCGTSLVTSVHFWNPHKGGRREPTL